MVSSHTQRSVASSFETELRKKEAEIIKINNELDTLFIQLLPRTYGGKSHSLPQDSQDEMLAEKEARSLSTKALLLEAKLSKDLTKLNAFISEQRQVIADTRTALAKKAAFEKTLSTKYAQLRNLTKQQFFHASDYQAGLTLINNASATLEQGDMAQVDAFLSKQEERFRLQKIINSQFEKLQQLVECFMIVTDNSPQQNNAYYQAGFNLLKIAAQDPSLENRENVNKFLKNLEESLPNQGKKQEKGKKAGGASDFGQKGTAQFRHFKTPAAAPPTIDTPMARQQMQIRKGN